MKLGSKILFSIFLVSSLIAAIGLTANWYTNLIQSEVINNNFTTAQLVEQIASVERGLLQSQAYLSAIKDGDSMTFESVTMDQPNSEILTDRFTNEIDNIERSISQIKQIIFVNEDNLSEEKLILGLIEDRFTFYSDLASEWLDLIQESEADEVFTTSINPYFTNNLMPRVVELRVQAINSQRAQNILLEQKMDQANLAIVLLTIVFVLLSISVAYYLYKSIANPLASLNQSAHVLGEGNLSERITLNGNDEISELGNAFNRMASNLEKRTLARDYLDSIIESIHEALIVTDTDNVMVGLNKATQQLLGYSREELIGKPITMIYNSEIFEEKLKNGIGDQETIEFEFSTKNGELIPVLFSESKLTNSNKDEVGSVVVATDITQRKRANERIRESLREKEVLLAEIHHRVKNNLAVISGILQLQSYSTTEETVIKALQESQSRIQSISLVHEMLYQSETLAFIEYDKYVKDLIHAISRLYEGDKTHIKLSAEVDCFSLDLNTAIPCSLLLNEVILNCYKHAFNGRDEGEIRIQITELEGQITFIVEDNGVGIPVDTLQKSKSLGLKLIKTLTNQLQGSYDISNKADESGTISTVTFSREKKLEIPV